MSTEKKIMLGCAGCLGVLLVLFLLVGGLTFVGVQSFQASGNRITAWFFGKKLPEGYKVIMAIEQPTAMLYLMNMRQSRNLIMNRSGVPEKAIAHYHPMTADKMKTLSKTTVTKANAYYANSRFESTAVLHLPSGDYPAVNLVQKSQNSYIPAVMTVLFFRQNGKNYLVSILMQDFRAMSDDANDPFEGEYAQLAEALEEIIPTMAFINTWEAAQK